MKLKIGYCPICKKAISIRNDSSKCSCPDCGHHIALHDVSEEKTMTKQEACDLENMCGTLMSKCVGEECRVSLALTGRLKISFNDGFITLKKDRSGVDYVKYVGYYEDLEDIIKRALSCVNSNTSLLDKLIWSYEHIRELE